MNSENPAIREGKVPLPERETCVRETLLLIISFRIFLSMHGKDLSGGILHHSCPPFVVGSTTLTVTALTDTQGILVYDQGADHDPDGDSDGTSITAVKP